MNDVSNKASICAIVHLEIIDFSKKADSERAQIKNELNHLINRAVIDIAHNNRAILNVADGAVIACIGVLTDALEDALLISLTIRDEILENNSLNSTPFYLRFGINLGAAKLFSSMNAKPSIVDESIEEAHSMMSFAKPNQILVSRAYYEMASKLSQEISQMFEYHDMHASEQEIYAVRMHKELAVIEELPSISPDNPIPHISPPINPAPDNLAPENRQAIISKINWNYVSLSLMVLIAFFVMAKLVATPKSPAISVAKPAIKAPTIKVAQPALKDPSPKTVANLPAKTADDFLLPNESVEKSPPEVNSNALVEQKIVQEEIQQKTIQEKVEQKVEQKTVQKKVKKNIVQKKARPKAVAEIKAETKTETKAEAPANTASKPVASKVEKDTQKDKSGWETFKNSVKQGTDRKCTQAEIALNQCR